MPNERIMIKQFISLIIASIFISSVSNAQQIKDWRQLEKMPADLEMQYALSALPPHLRDNAAVYLLDPKMGYYLAREGTNGFCTFINRTEWERGKHSWILMQLWVLMPKERKP